MLRRVLLVSLCALAVGALAASGFPGSASAGTTDLFLKERLCGSKRSSCQLISNGRRGSFGDTLVFSLPLRSRPDDVRVGRDEGECITLHRAAYCDFVAHLDGGDVAVQGTLGQSFTTTSTLAVVGGTDAYEGAAGFWQQTGQEVTLHLVIP